jgi:FkbM family methyltransferase
VIPTRSLPATGFMTTTSQGEGMEAGGPVSMLRTVSRALVPSGLEAALRLFYYRRMIRKIGPVPEAVEAGRYVRRGDTVIDIGANIGRYAKMLSAYVGDSGAVHCLEPMPETFGYLLSNMACLELTNVFCYNIAASDRCSMVCMNVPRWQNGHGRNLYRAAITAKGDFRVRALRLDDLFPDLRPSFIKCDVEGHEAEVVRGASNLIERCRPVWLMEVSDQKVVGIMRGLGYTQIVTHPPNSFFVPNPPPSTA